VRVKDAIVAPNFRALAVSFPTIHIDQHSRPLAKNPPSQLDTHRAVPTIHPD